jgi:hypothetical protein
MGEEGWIYSYDPETKEQLSQWKSPQSPRAKRARQVQSSTKSMLVVFLDVKGIVHMNLFLRALRSTRDFYCDLLRHLRENAR